MHRSKTFFFRYSLEKKINRNVFQKFLPIVFEISPSLFSISSKLKIILENFLRDINGKILRYESKPIKTETSRPVQSGNTDVMRKQHEWKQ